MNIQEVFHRQNARVYRLAMLYLKNPYDAEDAVQNIFLKFMDKDICFESPEHENAWFITVTKNYCKDTLKAFWRRNIDLGEIPEQSTKEIAQEELLDLVMQLPVKHKEVLYLYYYEEYSIKEMSSLLHRKESTIQTQLATARKKLKLVMESEVPGYER